jgi:sporulation protein YlmC with PRC-barrel domain
MDAIRDVLDNQLVDRKGRKMGKIDGLIMGVREGKPPRLLYLELGTTTLAQRLHPRLGKWARAMAKKWSVKKGGPLRIDFSNVTDIGIDVEVDLDASETSALAWEDWLREHVVARLPWGK